MKAIIFDWGGVCCAEGEPFASPSLQEALGLTPDQITDKVSAIHREYYEGKHTRDSFWNAIINYFGLEQNAHINPAALSDAYLNSYTLYPDVLDLVSRLKQRYQTGLLSNLTPEMKNQIQAAHELTKYFDIQVYSCDADTQSKKPDTKAFNVIVEKMKIKPEECLFIDNAPENVAAAAALGMKTILFKNRDLFFNDIKGIIEL